MNEQTKQQFTEVYEILKDQNEINRELNDQLSRVYKYSLSLEKRIEELEQRLDNQEDYEREMRERM